MRILVALAVSGTTLAGALVGVRPAAAGTPPPGAAACPVFPADNVWNADISQLPVDVPGEHPQSHAELRGREAAARCVEHRVGEVGDEGAQLLVEVDHRHSRGAQHWVTEESDGPDGHEARA